MACSSCGFERIEEGKSCPLCGAQTVSGTMRMDAQATEMRHGERKPSERRDFDLGAGDVFAERYDIVAPLGRGGMGAVYRARDRRDGIERALKILHATSDDPNAAGRFRREIQILSRIQHPSVVKIFDWGVVDERMYFAAELIEGDDLRAVLYRRGVLPPAEVAQIGGRVAEALSVAHRNGVVHRDVKPHNVMICSDGLIKLLDFGIARGAGIDLRTITTSGTMVGTPEYMSPEQFIGSRVDARSDIYSLGVVLYELAAGATPFKADTPVALGIMHQSTPPAPIRGQRPNVPAWLERVILKCLQKEPAHRFLTAAELAAELLRPRGGQKRVRILESGDQVMEDDSETEPWALTIVCAKERRNWSHDMALRFEERYYRLEDIKASSEKWIYNFSHWPAEQIFRKIVDYQQDVAERPRPGLGGKLKQWFSS